MAGQTALVPICILKVNISCCNGCQKTAKKRLQKVPGVDSIFYDTEEGLMMVSGDVNPRALVDKFTKRGKRAELVSVQNDSTLQEIKASPEKSLTIAGSGSCHDCCSQEGKPDQSHVLDLYHDSNANEASAKNSDQKKKRRKCFLLDLFGKNRGGAKVEPLSARSAESCKWQLPSTPKNARVLPNAPPMYPHYPPFYGPVPPLQPPPPPQYSGAFFQMGPPPSPPYGGGIFQPRPVLPPRANPMLYYTSYGENSW